MYSNELQTNLLLFTKLLITNTKNDNIKLYIGTVRNEIQTKKKTAAPKTTINLNIPTTTTITAIEQERSK